MQNRPTISSNIEIESKEGSEATKLGDGYQKCLKSLNATQPNPNKILRRLNRFQQSFFKASDELQQLYLIKLNTIVTQSQLLIFADLEAKAEELEKHASRFLKTK